MDMERISWHPAFFQALQLEFEEYLDVLRFEAEYQLTAEPLKIDALITKEPGAAVDKPIARIFRRFNLWEFKSPADTLAVHAFFKVFAYIGQFVSLNELDPEEVSFSLAVTRYPRSVMEFLRGKGRVIREQESGVYTVEGEAFALQIIETKKLSEENNLFLGGLQRDLTEQRAARILKEAERKHKVAMDAYLEVLWRANIASFKEAIRHMGDVIEQMLEETGLVARLEARGEARGMQKALGRLKSGESPVEDVPLEEILKETGWVDRLEARGKIQVAKNLIKKGWNCEEIVETTGLDRATVQSLITGKDEG